MFMETEAIGVLGRRPPNQISLLSLGKLLRVLAHAHMLIRRDFR